ncbi:MAG TPA: SUMF1/EgtB/PvdO family nonheme iron enzyme [Anaerolineales bacterium]|nr:SUMF1/EgtB/PvdO family nonheme iron enzyme [Anaerolineales bacterium]
MGHIFISYSHKDTDYAHALADNLQSMGFEVWIDERLDYGSQWPQELQTQLDSCSAFLLIMSPRSYTSEWVQSELQRAKRKLKPILPLLLEGDEPWLSVESTQYYDVRGEVYPDAKFYSALKKVITPTPGASTLQKPKEAIRKKATTPSSSRLKMGIVIGAIGVLLVAFIGSAVLLMPFLSKRITPNAPATVSVGKPTNVGVLSKESTSVPEATLTPEMTSEATQPPQIASTAENGMVLVPAGEFTMGRKASDEFVDCQKIDSECQLAWLLDEEPVHQVYVDSFYIDIYEVTNALYKACQDQGACDPPKNNISNKHPDYYGNPEYDNYPVIWVDWNMAKTYCEWRGARLPTEAEWEKAARGTDARPYPWGEKLDATFANYNYSVGDTTAVGSYEKGKSPFGLYDMAGNVWEWVSSLYRPYPYDATDGREAPSSDENRVVRGGSWGLMGDSVSVAFRYGLKPTDANMDLGFRCAKDANP